MQKGLSYEIIESDDEMFNLNLEYLRKFYPNSSFEIVKGNYESFRGILAKNFPTHNYFYVLDERVSLFMIVYSLKIPSDAPKKNDDEKDFDSFLIYLDNGGPYYFQPHEKIHEAYTEYKSSFDEEEIEAFETMLNRFDYPEEDKHILEAFKFAEDYFTMRPGRIKLMYRVDERQLKLFFPE